MRVRRRAGSRSCWPTVFLAASFRWRACRSSLSSYFVRAPSSSRICLVLPSPVDLGMCPILHRQQVLAQRFSLCVCGLERYFELNPAQLARPHHALIDA